jgi:hypothetical protein
VQDLSAILRSVGTPSSEPDVKAEPPFSRAGIKEEKSPKYPDPTPWSGDAKDLQGFLMQLQIKLSTNADWYPTEREKLNYALGRLKGKPLRVVAPFVQNKRFETCEALYDLLRQLSGHTHSREIAMRKLQGLRQGNTSFTEFIGEFDQLAEEAKADDTVRKIFLRNALNEDLSAALIYQKTPESFTAFVRLLMELDENLKQHRSVHPVRKHAVPRTSSRDAPVPAPSSATPASNALRRDTPTSNSYAKIGSEERERRKREGLCYICASADHLSSKCYYRDATFGKKPQAIVREGFLLEPLLSEYDSDSEEKAKPRA